MSTDKLPQHVQAAMQKVADIAGTSITNVDPASFADLPAPVDDSALARLARGAAAYQAEAAANREAAGLEELKATAAAQLPGNEEITEMARRYGISADLLLGQFAEKKAAAQELLGARQKTIEATRKAAEQAALEIRLNTAIAERNFSAMIDFGNDKSHPALQAVARAAMASAWPGWKWE